MTRWSWWCCLALSACGDPQLIDHDGQDDLIERVDLVDIEDWELVEPEDDPVPGRPPELLPCSPAAAVIEDDGLELLTEVCSWITVAAPLLQPVRRGDPIELLLFHGALNAPTPATASMELWSSAGRLWHQRVPVPGPARIFDVELSAAVDLEAGELVFVHVHNHGDNVYTLGHLRRP